MPAMAFAGGRLSVVYYDFTEDVSPYREQFVVDRVGPPPSYHTVDVRVAQADPDTMVFQSTKVSQYKLRIDPQTKQIIQLEPNPPNLPFFSGETTPFIGDYFDIPPAPIYVTKNGQWKFNTSVANAPVFHTAWTENRNVKPPADGDWTKYKPP